MTVPLLRWIGEGSPCLAPAEGGGRCGRPRRVADAVHRPGRMGLHPVEGAPWAPASAWQCPAGHTGWITSAEVAEVSPAGQAWLAEVLGGVSTARIVDLLDRAEVRNGVICLPPVLQVAPRVYGVHFTFGLPAKVAAEVERAQCEPRVGHQGAAGASASADTPPPLGAPGGGRK